MEDKQICYVVSISFGSWEDHYNQLDGVYLNKEEAVLRQGYLTDFYEEEVLFPFDWCTEDEFITLLDEDKNTEEDYKIFSQWDMERDRRSEFGGVYIQETELR